MGNTLTKCCSTANRRNKPSTAPSTTSFPYPSSSKSPPFPSSSAQARDIQLSPIILSETNPSATSSPSNTYPDRHPTSLNGAFDINTHSSKDQPINNSSLQLPPSAQQQLPPSVDIALNNNNGIHQPTNNQSYSTKATTIQSDQLQSLSLAQGLEKSNIRLTEAELKVLLANEIPASEIDNISIGVDSGGMGVIHVAEWKGVKVAIKEASDRVISKEVEIYCLMRGCEGVVKFYGVTYPPGLNKLCIVTKYAENGSLSWYLKVSFHKLTWSDKLKLATQITNAVLSLHKAGIFHRDLHGGNILIDAAGNAMLTDFGASTIDDRVAMSVDEFAITSLTTPEGESKFVSQLIPDVNATLLAAPVGGRRGVSGNKDSTMDMDNLNPTSTNNNRKPVGEEREHQLIGVMAYIAPERFRDPRSFDARCDIYSLGVLLWELTSGHAAFARVPQDVQLVVSILNGRRENPVEGTPGVYLRLYERCWDTDPKMRPSLDEILSTLATIQETLSDDQLAVTQERTVARSDEVYLTKVAEPHN
ncbi:hypothetical protein BGZ80_005750, partial [Entomortierella chlamydospora]